MVNNDIKKTMVVFKVIMSRITFLIIGGLAAVIYTDTFQTAVMTIGAIVLTVMGK